MVQGMAARNVQDDGVLSGLFTRVRTRWRFLAPLLAVNVAGMVFGWYYYFQVGQFNPSSKYYQNPAWWPLVGDSPNAVLLMFVALLAYRLARWRNKWLDAFAFILNIYVGLWTTMLFLVYSDEMGTFEWSRVAEGHANPVLFIAHMGMPLQAFVLLPAMRGDRWTWWPRVVVLAALAVYIFVDYWGPLLHPAPFLHPDDNALHTFSPWLMVGAAAVWLATTLARPRPVDNAAKS